MTAQPYDMAQVAKALARPNSAVPLFAYVREGLIRDVGCGLMTASIYDLEAMRSRRVFTDNDQAYQIGNFKRLDRNRYYETVIEAAQPFSTTRIEQIAEVFFDWEHIEALGYGSNLNLPAIADGKVIGTINLLEKTGHYTPERVARAMAWQPLATLCFLLLMSGDPETADFLGRPHASGAVIEGAHDQLGARPLT
ncbi:hypothetical protein [Pelagibacterium xiamenense]|uniref:hypothetical protein n=1 Tax=Pelagibacterium xiamenense TaxID=2901140 RepID=UPI001E2A61BA|nr:hypothetical protein [Pelagibacterium xiamenense]MCD7061428.1 hypothetical protein [Pelagibacterium xiamenense]